MSALYQWWHAITTRVVRSRFWTQTLPPILVTLGNYGELMRLHRPIGIYLLLWPMLWALWMASQGHPNQHVFIVFVLGVLLTRSAGCVINDFADRKFDAQVKRTKDRPLVDGRLEPSEALIVFFGLVCLALALVLTLDRMTQLYALAGALMIVTYPFFKRFFALPQAYLGLAFSWSIPMTYAAQTGSVPVVAWVLFLANVAWTMAYDTIYAMVDRDDDIRIGIKSSAIVFGDADRAMVGLLQFLTLLALALIGLQLRLSYWYYLGLLGAIFFICYQQVLISDRDRDGCFRAFLNNNYFGMSVFLGVALHYLFD